MKILILSFYYHPDLCAGSFRCTSLVEQLKKQVGNHVDIEVITTLPNRYSSFYLTAPKLEQDGAVTIRRIELPGHNSGMLDQARVFLHFAAEVRKLVKKEHYDLVFATSSRLMTAVLGAWVAKKKKAKLYLDIRDIFVDTIGDILPKKMVLSSKPFFSFLERWAFTRADHINLVSEGFRDYFEQRYRKNAYSWYTNGIDTEFANLKIEDNAVSINKPMVVLYAGNIGQGQGLHTIIPGLAKRMGGKVQFKIFGDGGRRLHLLDELKKMDCQNVEVFPPINREALIKEYQNADILFLHLGDFPAFKKVLPSKLFEYGALGKPIWAGVSGYAADFIKAELSNAVVFHPGDDLGAEKSFQNLVTKSQVRQDFIDKYSRPIIMKKMAKDILTLV